MRTSQMIVVLSWLAVAMCHMSGDQAQAKPKSRCAWRGRTGRPVSASKMRASGESPTITRRRPSGEVEVQLTARDRSTSDVKVSVSQSRTRRWLSFEAKIAVGEWEVRCGMMSMWFVMPFKSRVT